MGGRLAHADSGLPCSSRGRWLPNVVRRVWCWLSPGSLIPSGGSLAECRTWVAKQPRALPRAASRSRSVPREDGRFCAASRRADQTPPVPRAWILFALFVAGLGLVLDAVFGTSLRIPFDGGDVLRELQAAGQWGQFFTLLVVSVCFIRLQPERWRRVLDLALAVGVVALVVLLLKLCFGRLRPGARTRSSSTGGCSGSAMPPRARWLRPCVPPRVTHPPRWCCPSSSPSCGRGWHGSPSSWPWWWRRALVLFAHWLGDVLLGGLIGYVAYPVIRGFWGVQLLDWIWARLIDSSSRPALPMS